MCFGFRSLSQGKNIFSYFFAHVPLGKLFSPSTGYSLFCHDLLLLMKYAFPFARKKGKRCKTGPDEKAFASFSFFYFPSVRSRSTDSGLWARVDVQVAIVASFFAKPDGKKKNVAVGRSRSREDKSSPSKKLLSLLCHFRCACQRKCLPDCCCLPGSRLFPISKWMPGFFVASFSLFQLTFFCCWTKAPFP